MMTPTHWKRCFLVSLIVAVFATPLSMSFYSVTLTSEEEVWDLSKIDSEKVVNGSLKEVQEHMESIPTKRLSFIESVIYPFTHPQILLFFLQGLITWFSAIFVATVLTTYLNINKP